MAFPILIPAVSAAAGFVQGFFTGSDDDEASNSTGGKTGKYLLYGLAAVGTYTVYKGAKTVIQKGST